MFHSTVVTLPKLTCQPVCCVITLYELFLILEAFRYKLLSVADVAAIAMVGRSVNDGCISFYNDMETDFRNLP